MVSVAAITRGAWQAAGSTVTYSPLDLPKQVAGKLWIVDSGPMNVYGMPMPIRMTVIRLANGDLLLHSPTRHTPELQAALEREGRIRHLIAPNIAHWSFAQQWQRAVPGSLLWAAPKLASRRAVGRTQLRIDRELGEHPPAEWRDEIEQSLIAGVGFCEVALFHRSSSTLILTDTVVNLEPRKLPLPMALLMWLARATAPNGGGAALPTRPSAAETQESRAGHAAAARPQPPTGDLRPRCLVRGGWRTPPSPLASVAARARKGAGGVLR